MIPGFSNTVKSDINCISNYINSDRDSQFQRDRVALAAIRILAVVGMAFSALSIIPVFTATTAGQAIARIVIAVTTYVLNHGFFTLARNYQQGPVSEVRGRVGAFLANGYDSLMQNEDVAPRHYLTKGTLCRPFWNLMFDLYDKINKN